MKPKICVAQNQVQFLHRETTIGTHTTLQLFLMDLAVEPQLQCDMFFVEVFGVCI